MSGSHSLLQIHSNSMGGLLACPFCRNLYDFQVESRCPECDLTLKPAHLLSDLSGLEPVDPDPIRSLADFRDGRGLLLLVSALGLFAFSACPWLHVSSPYVQSRSGVALAQGQLGWLWGGGVGWFTALPLVFSRRTAHQMRGVRALLVVLAAMTLVEGVVLLARPPTASPLVRFQYTWGWGFWASLALALCGVVLALRFGKPTERAPK